MRSVVWIRRFASAGLVLGAAAALASNASCVLIDGPADLPLPAIRRPTILHGQVAPSAAVPLGEFPVGGFVVPLEIPDPTQSVTWSAFLDLDLSSGANPGPAHIETETIQGSSDAPNIAYVNFTPPAPRAGTGNCHTIHFVVALGTSTDDIDPNLSDTIDWQIVPGGNPGGCTTYDGGGYSLIPDAAGADASDGGGD
ncbi:MAG: hypothetical protein ABI183_07305 [Polyangiaceae bacterium]